VAASIKVADADHHLLICPLHLSIFSNLYLSIYLALAMFDIWASYAHYHGLTKHLILLG